MVDRENVETLAVGVGVAVIEGRCFAGGGPIDPSTARLADFDVEVGPGVELFTRTLGPKAGILTDGVERDSVDDLHSLVLVLDITEEGREGG